jgi:hypothetical protein
MISLVVRTCAVLTSAERTCIGLGLMMRCLVE